LLATTGGNQPRCENASRVQAAGSAGGGGTLPSSCSQESTEGEVTGTSHTTTITAGATAYTKGNYTQLVASTPFASDWLLVLISNRNWASGRYLVDIATGAAGSEVVKIANLYYTGIYDATTGASIYLLPYKIPASSRVSARCEDNGGGTSIDVEICLLNGVGGGYSNCETGGAVTASPNCRGTAIASHANAHTKGAWVELLASLSAQWRYGVLSLSGLTAARFGLVDLGKGAAGSEAVIVDNLGAFGYPSDNWIIPLPLTIASASRLAARFQASVGSSTIYGIVYGCY